jgi:hypothetical protein
MPETTERTPAAFDDRTTEHHQYSREMAISGAPKMPLHGRRGQQYVIEGARASWVHGRDIEWIEVRGAIRNEDGTRGEDVTVKYFTPALKGMVSGIPGAAPVWLLKLFGVEASADPKA